MRSDIDAESVAEMNQDIFTRHVKIRLADGQVFENAVGTRVSTDSTVWLTAENRREWSVATSQLGEISYKNRGKGAVHGLAIGAVTLFSVFMVAPESDEAAKDDVSRFEAAVKWGAPAGALYGAGIGAIWGYRTKYQFRTSVEPFRNSADKNE